MTQHWRCTDQRPHAYALLRTLVRTETWSVDKCLSDARRLVARCGEQPPLLHAMFIIQQLFRYVSKHTHAHHCHFPHPSLFMRVCV